MNEQPITPKKLAETEIKFPDYVVRSFNKLITNGYNKARNKSSLNISFTIKQEEAIEEILKQAKLELIELTRVEIFSEKLLDVEKFYEKAGWKMVYDSPSRDEDYDPYWTVTIN